MKKTSFINLNRMRKISSDPLIKLSPIAATVILGLSGCSNKEDVIVVSDPEDCQKKTNLSFEQCDIAYKNALAEAERTSPKYPSEADCSDEFNRCRQTSSGSWMPFMSGYMMSSLINRNNYSSGYHQPVFRYDRPYTSSHNKIMTADGTIIGDANRSSYKAPKSATKSKPTVTRTISRGQFGSTASAKSSWGGGKSSSWGG